MVYVSMAIHISTIVWAKYMPKPRFTLNSVNTLRQFNTKNSRAFQVGEMAIHREVQWGAMFGGHNFGSAPSLALLVMGHFALLEVQKLVFRT